MSERVIKDDDVQMFKSIDTRSDVEVIRDVLKVQQKIRCTSGPEHEFVQTVLGFYLTEHTMVRRCDISL